ncbi:MAG: hybrid sensor histidine kinase/response regulator [Rhodomicrobium sp.]
MAGIIMQLDISRQIDDVAYVAIVDDLELNRIVLENLSKKIDDITKVKTFSSAEAALEDFIESAPDLIITDFSMPTMDATAFLKMIRKTPGLEETPVIVVSANEKVENRRNALLCGATDFLTTPLDVFEFQARVRNLLRLGLHQKILRISGLSLKQKLTETRLRSIKQVQASREHFTHVIDCVPALILAVNGDGQAVFANEYCFEFFGGSSMEAVLNQLRHGDTTKPEPVEIDIKDREGETHTFLIMGRVVPESPMHESIVVYSGIDISTLKRTEESLRAAKSQAEAASHAKSAFLANMSHEIRTPLNAIIGFADLIHSETFGPIRNIRYTEYLKDILSSAEHLLFIIDEVLDFSQLEKGQHALTISEFSLSQFIAELRAMIQLQIKARRNNLIFNQNEEVMLKSDSQKLFQVLLNIITNANKFMEGGVIRVDVSQNRDGGMTISVKDHGIGMSDEELVVALSNFGRIANPCLRASAQGVGLGLPISVGFMKLLGGKLEISSKKGAGTRVDLILPASSVVAVKPALRLLANQS